MNSINAHGLTFGFEIIGPSQAIALLEKSDHNRVRNKQQRFEYWADMYRSGRYSAESAIPISITSDGRVVNGCGRLGGVVKHGKPVKFFVVRGVPFESFKLHDQHDKRTDAQILSMFGTSNGHDLAAAMRVYDALCSGITTAWDYDYDRRKKNDVLELYSQYGDMEGNLGYRFRTLKIPRSLGYAAFYALTRVYDRGAVEALFRQLDVGGDMKSGSPLLAARQCVERITRSGRPRAGKLLYLVIAGCDETLCGKRRDLFRLPRDGEAGFEIRLPSAR